MNPIVVAVAAYLIGSVSFAVLVSRAFALPDPRSYGSGNPGATNVLRTGRKAAAVLTLAGDAAKGWVAVALAHRYGEDPALAAGMSNTEWIARTLFTRFLLPFEVAALILTVAVIAAVMLTLRRRPGARHQDPSEQARVRAADRIRMVKMEAVKPQAPAAGEEVQP